MAQDIFTFTGEQIANGKKVAMITVTKTTGSSPASVGQVIAVTADGQTAGTVGGGASEYRVVQQAIEEIKKGSQIFEFSFDHAENGMVCGGGMSGFGNILGNEARIVIFGGGHVAQALAPIALTTGFAVTIVEDRPELAKEFNGVQYIVTTPEEYAQQVPASENMYAVIATRGHKTDSDALRFCVNNPYKYIGMIGSAKKVASVFTGMKNDGVSKEKMEKVFTPVGLNIASEVPAEIAISVLAEILLLKNNGTPQHKKDTVPELF